VRLASPNAADVLMDSRPIALALESAHPTPSLHLLDDGSSTAAAAAAIKARIDRAARAWGPLRPVWMPRVPPALLAERSREFFVRTRAVRLGMPLERLEEERGGEAAWEKARPGFVEMAALLGETEGPFFLGQEREFCSMCLAGVG
jgi:hypothetical protein